MSDRGRKAPRRISFRSMTEIIITSVLRIESFVFYCVNGVCSIMESLRSLSSRLLIGANDDDDFEHEPEQKEKQWAIQRCMELSEYDEENTIIMWIKKIKQSEHKQHKRLMVITDVRLFTARRGGSKKKPKFEVRRESHILDLTSVQEAGLILNIHFRDFEVSFECNDDDLTQKILGQLYKNYIYHDPGFPTDLRCKWLDQYKADQERELQKKYPVIGGSLAPWERPARAFKSWAYFYKEANKDKLSLGLKSILRRPLDDMVVDDERWLHTKSLGCQNPKTIHGAILCVAFTSDLLQGIEVSDVRGDEELLFAVKCLLKYNVTLGSLVLDGCATGPEWGGLLVNALQENSNLKLKRFGLRNCRIGDKGVMQWIEGNKKVQRHASCIYMTKANCSSKTMIGFIQSLHSSLEELDISENPLDGRGTVMLATRLTKDFKNLKMLNLSKCNIDCPVLLKAIEHAAKNGTLQLEEINLSYNKMTQQDGLVLSRILANTGTCAALGLAGCGLSGPTVAACLASVLSNENLQFYARLDLSDNNIGCDAAIMFASIFVLTDRIMSLKVNNCDLTHEGMGYILMSLLTQPRLKELEMDFNCKRSQWNSGKYHVNQMLRKLLEKCLNLQSLSIKNDPERGFQVDLDHFLHALKTNDSLMSLDISGNSMTSDNLAALKDVVISNQVLRELHWDQNNITSKHILGITHALKQNKALQIVQFPEMDFDKELLREKSAAKKMELQMMKKNFYRAVFENATTSGFQQSATNYKRAAAKRGSFMADRTKMEIYQPQKGGKALGLPQFSGNGPNVNQPGGGGGGKGMKGMPPPNPMGRGMPPPNPMNNGMNGMNGMNPGGMGMPPPNPMNGMNSMNGMGGLNGMPPPNPNPGSYGGGMPPPNPMQNRGPPQSSKSKKKKRGRFESQGPPPPQSPGNGNGMNMNGRSPPPQKERSKQKRNRGPPPNPNQQNNKGPPPNPMMGGMGGNNNGNGMGPPPPNMNMNMMGGMGPPPPQMMMNGQMGGMPPPNMMGFPPMDPNMMMGPMPPMDPNMMNMGMNGMPPPMDPNMMMNGMPPPNMMMGPPPQMMMNGNMGGMGPPPPNMGSNMNMMGGMGPPPNMGQMGGMPPPNNMGGQNYGQ